jgi:hypothetical protein
MAVENGLSVSFPFLSDFSTGSGVLILFLILLFFTMPFSIFFQARNALGNLYFAIVTCCTFESHLLFLKAVHIPILQRWNNLIIYL